MITTRLRDHLAAELEQIRAADLFKAERELTTAQQARIGIADGQQVINMCANNYLGLANHPEVIAAARDALERWGYGLSSVRFICGTQSIHRQLEKRISQFLGTEDTILYTSCFDANGGLFETLLGAEDAVISDELNHASIIDGIRLCKAQRHRYRNSDMKDLEAQLTAASGARFRMVATDGVFSMDGYFADLASICDLAEAHDALVMVDDSHAVGFVGDNGRGSHERSGVMGRIDLITGTLGKALGGASGGYTSGRTDLIALLRQRSRPYLFSNSVAPSIVAASLKAIEIAADSADLRTRLADNTQYFRQGLTDLGLEILPGSHPIVPIMLGEASLAQQMAARLLEKGVYAIGFFYPVVPQGKARIRTQVSAAHSRDDLDFVLEKVKLVKAEMGI
ncbi:MAG: glycine C-acetyltransferase [Gemmatimonadetes bacterium]|jgi:glycine C-acetyltransferase|nr:glycine C-acetyltransferase [Gemmatimonadota bacterium]MBT7860363.1 glycine C-acetyltransferase [Gemmatimonadota bacterium]